LANRLENGRITFPLNKVGAVVLDGALNLLTFFCVRQTGTVSAFYISRSPEGTFITAPINWRG
jgi:hypothetical protein